MTAHADATASTIYVNNQNAACSDAGTGSAAVPFCTLQAGVDAAVPGDTVSVLGVAYRPVTITHSGTASQPISIVATTSVKIQPVSGGTTTAFTFTDVSYVSISNFYVPGTSTQYAYVAGSNHVTIDKLLGETTKGTPMPNYSSPGIEITGDSSSVTVSRSELHDLYRTAPSIQIDAGSTGDVITTNGIANGTILATDAAGTDITSNSIVQPTSTFAYGTGISLTGTSTGSSIENNVVLPDRGDNPTTPIPLIEVDAAATSGTTVDYNTVGAPNAPTSTTTPDYEWSGKAYQDPTAFHAATGQAGHDLIGDPEIIANAGFGVGLSAADSTMANNANSAAPGELATDINGDSRIDDPLYPQTGAGPYAYYDRGAAQLQPDTAADTVTPSAVGALGVIASSQNWSTSGYTVDFGDGTGTVSGAYGTAKHTYTEPGTYTITVAGTSSATGQPFTDSTTFTTTALSSGSFFDIERSASGTWWGEWDRGPANSTGIAQAAITALPDGDSEVVAVTTGGVLEHSIYQPSGVWQAWGVPKNNATVTSASLAGMPDGSTQIIEITTSGTLEHTIRYANGSWQATGWGSPAGSTGIKQAAITAMPDGSTQLVAVTTAGTLEHNIRNANGSWQGWRTLTQPGVTVTDASLAGMPNGSTQIVEVTSAGVLKHDIRNANGTWQASGWGSPAGSTGIAAAAIAAMPNGSTQLVASTTGGVLEHDLRNANGAWQTGGWGDPTQTDLAAGASSPSIAGLPDGTSQITEVSTN